MSTLSSTTEHESSSADSPSKKTPVSNEINIQIVKGANSPAEKEPESADSPSLQQEETTPASVVDPLEDASMEESVASVVPEVVVEPVTSTASSVDESTYEQVDTPPVYDSVEESVVSATKEEEQQAIKSEPVEEVAATPLDETAKEEEETCMVKYRKEMIGLAITLGLVACGAVVMKKHVGSS